jgi:hypothetical protein
MDTGDGILGTNMYAYCGNDPLNRVDPTGYVWWEYFITFPELPWGAVSTYNEVHNAVTKEIVRRSGGSLVREKRITYGATAKSASGNNYGQGDIISLLTNEVWDVKPYSFGSYDQARNQLSWYTTAGSYWNNSRTGRNSPLTVGGDLPGGSFSFTSKRGYMIDVNYWYQSNGVIFYDFYSLDYEADLALLQLKLTAAVYGTALYLALGAALIALGSPSPNPVPMPIPIPGFA